jgi:hypothetical protein
MQFYHFCCSCVIWMNDEKTKQQESFAQRNVFHYPLETGFT